MIKTTKKDCIDSIAVLFCFGESILKQIGRILFADIGWEGSSTWTGALDRYPCGTGTCAKMATLYAENELKLNQDFRHEGILGTVYNRRLVREVKLDDCQAVVPTISGEA